MSQTTITLLFLVFTIISFILEKIPLGLTASICAIGLTLTGVVDATTTFSQYVNSNVILCVGMFVVGQALFETGMANKIGGLVTKFARTEKTLIIAIMVIVGVMSGFLSNTGTAAVLIPVVCGIADESGYSEESYGADDYADNGTESSAGKARSFKLDLSTWYGKAIVIAIAALIVILLTTVLVAVAPFLIIFGIVLYLISWYRKKKV